MMPFDTRDTLGPHAEKCDSRSLFLDRFAEPAAKDSGDQQPRRDWFVDLLKRPAVRLPGRNRLRWAETLAQHLSGLVFHAQIQSRLMVNTGGGVMENAGLCLDRFGLPHIPGSAVKGCARRLALAALREWCEAGGQPEHKPTGADNPFTPACSEFSVPAEMLAAIARVFGWSEQDWNSDRDKKGLLRSDFAWACAGPALADPITEVAEHSWEVVRLAVVRQLASEMRLPVKAGDDQPWKRLPNVAGNISFLPAYPTELPSGTEINGTQVPAPGQLELDVVTCHHPKYYASNRPNAVATDDELPNPVVFPAVAPGHVFTFTLVPLRGADSWLNKIAILWLKTGLTTFGLGSKTRAGYGWFMEVTEAVQARLKTEQERQVQEAARKSAEEKAAADAKAKAEAKATLEAELSDLSPEERADRLIQRLSDAQFDAKVRAFCKEPKKGGPTEEERQAIVRALRGPRISYWQNFKPKATKGDLATVDQAIRQLSKQLFPGKEGRMP